MNIPKDAKHVTQESIIFAVSFMFLAMLLFNTANTFVKYLGGVNPPPIQVVFFRNLLPLIGLYIYFLVRHKKIPEFDKKVMQNFGLRSVFSTIGLSSLFYAYMHGNLADVTAISFTSPLFISIMAMPLLQEHLTWRRVVGLLIGFGGVLVIARPTGDINISPAIGSLVYACSAAYLMVTDRKLRHYYTSAEIVFYFSFGCSVISIIPTIIFWQAPSYIEWVLLGVIGVLGGLAQLCIALAYRRAHATVVAQTAYVSVIIAAIYNYFLFDVKPTVYLIVGSLLIIGGGIYIVLYEKRK